MAVLLRMHAVYCFLVFYLISCVICIYPFQNTSLSWDFRVNDLVQRLTLDEITQQMSKGGGGIGGPAPAIPRLGIKPFQWNTECLRGVALSGKATAFPQSINLAAMFSAETMERVASAIGAEVRAKANNYTAHGSYSDHQGLNCWAPMINIMRHPLWGRNQEVYGEDPYLTGRLATAYVQGLQGNNDRYIQAAASCKAFVAYAGPEDIPVSRLNFDAKISDRDLFLTYLQAFKQCVTAGAYSYMCSYNSVNGIPMCANKRILNDIMREEWGFKGFVVSDTGAIEAIVETHKYLNNTLDTVKATLEAGCNLELSANIPKSYYDNIAEAVREGLVKEKMVREMAKPLFYTRMRLGEFDPLARNPYTGYNLDLVQSQDHQDRAVEAAMKSFVLLKYDDIYLQPEVKLIPIERKYKKVAILGPMANNLNQLYGDYNADIDPAYASTPLQGLQDIADHVSYASGCLNNTCTTYNQSAVRTAVQDVEMIIICLGTGAEVESEGRDRRSMDLPGEQTQVVSDALTYGGNAPILLLLFSAGPLNLSFVEWNPRVPAIMQCFFPAQATGKALFNTLYHYTKDRSTSPAGRLPYTWYATADQIPSMVNYSMDGRTYRYFDGVPAYPFGYGLSYSTFSYASLVYDRVINQYQDYFYVGVTVYNNYERYDSDEVTQVYISWLTTKEKMPKLQLVAFERNFIPALGEITVNFRIKVEQLAVWSTTKGFLIEKGEIAMYVGGQQPFQKKQVPSNILEGRITIQESWKLTLDSTV